MNKTSAAIVRTLLLGTSCLSVLGLGLDAAKAQPTGGNVVMGGATISDHGGNATTINQTTGKAVINWNSFSIAAGGTVQFNQPGSSSITLNRVIGPESSAIYGNLLANGQVWLINGNGVLFGKGSRINVGGLIATTADIANGDFASGNYAFGGGTGASVVNQGTIKAAKGGSVVLSGASVSNQGVIEAETGTVVLGGASAFTVDFVGDGLIKYAIAAPAGQADNGQTGVSNSGTISAQGGHVLMTARAAADVADAVVNNTGMISATSAKMQNGEVVLDGGDGDVNVSGTIDASGTGSGETGGSVAVTGRNVTVADNTNINVSGDAGGGSVNIGGDAHGAGPLQNAANTHVGTATIKADAIHSGNGGTLVVWSNGLTDFSGIFSAKGGASGGNGGFVETSGHTLNIGTQARIDTTAPKGQTGTWLLDPQNIVISSGEGSNTQLTGGLLAIGTDPGQSDQVTPTTIINALVTTNVTLQASNNIAVQSAVVYSSVHDLNLMAKNEILVAAPIQNTLASGGGAITLVAGWDGTTSIANIFTTPNAYGFSNGDSVLGDVLISNGNGNVAVGSASGTTTVAASALGVDATNSGYAQLGYHGAGGGDIVVRTTGDLDVHASSSHFAMIGNGSLDNDVSGDITGNIDIRLGGSVSILQFGEGSDSPTPWIGNAAGVDNSETGNVVLVSANTDGNSNVDFLTNLVADLQGGDFLLGISDPNQFAEVGDLEYTSAHTLSLVAAGEIDLEGVIQNDGTGAINVIAGWDGKTTDPAHLADAGVYGNGGIDSAVVISGFQNCDCDGPFNASVGSKGGKVTVAGGLIILEADEGYAQIGYHGAGGGAITVLSTSDVILDGNSGDFGSYAQIGNGAPTGSITGAVTGDIFLSAAGTVVLASDAGNGDGDSPAPVLIGNAGGDGPSPASYSGNVTVLAADINDVDVFGSGFGGSLVHDIAGGDVTVGMTDSENELFVSDDLDYNSSHSLTLLSAGDMVFGGSLQNAGNGTITLVAGWDGTTLDPAHLLDAGVFGNNLGSITIGGPFASGDVAVGSSGGTTTFAAQNVSLTGANGFAQAGYHGGGSGAIVIDALGAISLSNDTQIGGGATFGSNATSGDVSLTAQTITAGANSAVTAAALTATTTGSIGASGASLSIAANTLNVTTNGGDVFLTSPSKGLTLAGVSLNGGAFTLSAGGAIAQSAAIHAGALNVSTTTGAITLLNGGNSFGALTVATQGSDAASLASGGPIVVAGAQVGGTLTLNANGAISQTGALAAGGLILSANGAITLNNGGNSFATLAVTTGGGNNAALTDAAAVTLGASTVGGTLTLASGGAIGQTGAVTAGGLVLSAGGAILLNNAGNSFAALALTTGGANSASVTDSTGVVLGASTVGGTLTLTSGGAISQSGAITAGGLVLSANGAIVLNNGSNSFATLAVTTSGANDAALTDAAAVTLGASTVGGKLTLASGGAIAQSGILTTHGLNLSTTSGGITLTNTGNAVAGLVQFNAPGAVDFYNTLATNVGASSAGGDLTLLSTGNVNFLGSVQSSTGNVTAVAGWDGTTTNAAQFGNSGVYGNGSGSVVIGGAGATGNVAVGSQSGTTSVFASALTIMGTNGYAQLGYHGTGGGAILVRALHDMTLTGGSGFAMLGNGSLNADVTGNVTGNIDVRIGGNANFNGGGNTQDWLGNVAHSGTETGNVILIMNDSDDGQQSHGLSVFIAADLVGGDFTVGFTGTGDQGPSENISYNSAHTLNALVAGNFVFAGSVQNAGTGAINVVAGWDGHTLSGFGAAGVAGNGGKGVVIGGSTASGNVALGSAGGQTSVYGASLVLNAVHGYAQLGFNGHGSGAILVNVTGGVTLAGGAAAGEFAQIGNGGLKTSGNNSGDITIVAGGDLALNGGAGSEAYAQIGEGGAESNTGSAGYNNTAAITVTAANVLLNAGGGSAAYTMIGNGGYKSGLNLAGAGVNGGNITITSGHNVSLHGNGADAFAQIGNGGSQSNLNPTASATGTDSGDIVVHAPNGASGAVILAAGTGANSYAQIGNGGYAANAGAAVAANFTITGNVSVTDLSLAGGNGGANSFADIGNGDASLNSVGNVSGNILIDANGHITFVNGTAPHSPGTIGNFTGLGLILGLLTGASPPSEISTNPAALGVIASNTANNKSNTNDINTISTIVVTPSSDESEGATNLGTTVAAPPGPIALLDNGKDSTTPSTADSATIVIADSLDGAKKAGASQSILGGMLKANPAGAGQSTHGVPPADQDFSSWGNEALWQ